MVIRGWKTHRDKGPGLRYAKWLQNLKHSDSSGRRARTIHLGTAKGTAKGTDFFWGKKYLKTQVRLQKGVFMYQEFFG